MDEITMPVSSILSVFVTFFLLLFIIPVIWILLKFILCENRQLKLYYKIVHPDAIPLLRSHGDEDEGFDLALVDIKKIQNDVTYYGTGISIESNNNMWFMLAARSSLSKTGTILANGVGIIDHSYRGEIIVPLIKIDDALPDIELGTIACQIIPFQHYSMTPELKLELQRTKRGSRGFGGTTGMTIIKDS